jgi:integrase
MRQALLWVLWDSGFRISEALSLRVGSVTLDGQDGAHLELPRGAPHLKTGPRTIYVSESVPALRVWLEHHPVRDDPTAPLFPSNHEPAAALEPTTVNKILADYSKGAKLERIITCHLFRHTRATRAAKAGWNEPKLNAYFGWAPGSRESATYVHLAAVDVEAEIRAAARIDPVGAMIREDPTKALQTAVAAAVAQAVPTAVAETIRQLRANGIP